MQVLFALAAAPWISPILLQFLHRRLYGNTPNVSPTFSGIPSEKNFIECWEGEINIVPNEVFHFYAEQASQHYPILTKTELKPVSGQAVDRISVFPSTICLN